MRLAAILLATLLAGCSGEAQYVPVAVVPEREIAAECLSPTPPAPTLGPQGGDSANVVRFLKEVKAHRRKVAALRAICRAHLVADATKGASR